MKFDHKKIISLTQIKEEDVKDLPKEILDDLTNSSLKKVELIILKIINDNENYASKDQLIVKSYSEHGKFYKKNELSSLIFRMRSKGLIHSVPGYQGIYSTIRHEEVQEKQTFLGLQIENESEDTKE